jgi:hypothetical protein
MYGGQVVFLQNTFICSKSLTVLEDRNEQIWAHQLVQFSTRDAKTSGVYQLALASE